MSNDNHAFPWYWKLSDLDKVQKNGYKVFSCFSCGGGSSMGYKLAGYDVIGNCELDEKINEIYKANNHPRFNFCMDVRDLLELPNDKMPEELFSLDVLDGSPPCSVFSVAYVKEKREERWGNEQQFAEGQKLQRLDDLFFFYLDLANRLRPKVIVAENVKGLISGKAKGYVNEIIKKFKEIGYTVQIFMLNSVHMGVPQKRERVFFIARRNDLNLDNIKMSFDEPQINFGDVRTEHGIPFREGSRYAGLMQYRKPDDDSIKDIEMRISGKYRGFTNRIVQDNEPFPVVTGGSSLLRGYDGTRVTEKDLSNVQTFPQDYDFGPDRTGRSVQFITGMSVPPVMMAQISKQIQLQWLNKLKK